MNENMDRRRCVVGFHLDALGQLMNLPAGARIVGMKADKSQPSIVFVEIEGAGVGLEPPATPPLIELQILNSFVHIVRWDLKAVEETRPAIGDLNWGQRAAQPSLAPAGDEPPASSRIVQFPKAPAQVGEAVASFPCEPDEEA